MSFPPPQPIAPVTPSASSSCQDSSALSADSRRRVIPSLAVKLLLVALITWFAGAAYTVYLNPEITFFKRIAAIKHAWAARMTRQYGAKTVFFGGSSCTFSINPGRLLQEHALPSANLGLGAGMGLRVLTRSALEHVHPGDTLVMAMEPAVLLTPLDDPMLGIQFSYALGRPHWLAEGGSVDTTGSVRWIPTALMLRPGGYHVFTLLGKLASGKPLYRYQVNEVDATGWEQTAIHREPAPSVGEAGSLPEDVRQFLLSLKQWCDQREVRIAYSLPWTYTDPSRLDELRENNRRLLHQISSTLPVLKDSTFGADTNRAHFADTVWHLTKEGADMRTDIVAKAVLSWDVWSPADLNSGSPAQTSPQPP